MNTRQSQKARRAMRRCFTTPEIFECILLNLDIQELLFAQLVHTHFKSFIKQSTVLQQRLFFVPDPTRTTPELHPILKRRFPALFSLKKPDEVLYFHDFSETTRKLDWFTDENYRERMIREDASWRRMFPVQPPAKLESIKIWSHHFCVNRLGHCVPAQLGSQCQHLQETGIKMGLLYDIVVHFHSAMTLPRFYIHWQMFPTEGEGPRDRDDIEDTGGFEDLYPLGTEKRELENSITFYYQHAAYCDGRIENVPLLKINSPFISMVEEDPSTLLRFLKTPESDEWAKYLKPKRRARLEEKLGGAIW
ncbi:unnamed protein product [Clonostachys chloroleuca]|uniref:F-box domain-containing protein n=1 Tax=Clonostachys chloroleuca TaxID=1926264 RepID=A0AA35PXS8_9HYPO|nr:unnamed protein product [Clonostachys chloroleuca]